MIKSYGGAASNLIAEVGSELVEIKHKTVLRVMLKKAEEIGTTVVFSTQLYTDIYVSLYPYSLFSLIASHVSYNLSL